MASDNSNDPSERLKRIDIILMESDNSNYPS